VRAFRFILVGLMLTSWALSSYAFVGGWQQHRNDSPPSGQHSNSQANGQFHVNGPGPHRGDWLRQNWDKPVPQQEQQLRQDPHFRNLPPDQQQKLIDRLHNFDSLPPDEKAKILNRMDKYEHMSPSQQQAARAMFDRLRALPPDRQSRVNQAYRQLRDLSPDQRNQLLNSNAYRNNFSGDELDLLRGMSDLTAQNR
jgi:Protein of unknown function (DUF3106)